MGSMTPDTATATAMSSAVAVGGLEVEVTPQPDSREGCTAATSSSITTLRFAEMLHQRGKHAESAEVLERHLCSHPHDLDAAVLRGRCLEAVGNAAGAFTCYASALTQDPHHVKAHLACASLYKSRGMLNEAIDSLTSARAAAPDNEAVCQAMAIVLTDLGTGLKLSGALTEAMERYKEAQEADPHYAPAWYNMGVALTEAGQPEQAPVQYRKAIELHPHYAEAHCNMGVLHKNNGELEEAIVCYQKAVEAAPNLDGVTNNLAVALTDLGTKKKAEGKTKAAIQLYEKALSYSPKYLHALYNSAVAYTETGQLDKAIFMYEMASQFHPNCAESLNNMGLLYKERGNPDKAMQCYMAALQLRPNFPESLNNVGVMYTLKGLAKEGLASLQAAVQASPTYAEAYNNLGVLHRDVGNIAEAIAAYEKCIELAPDARNASHNRLLALNYIYPGEEPYVCQAHRDMGQQFSAGFQGLLPPLDTAAVLERGTSQNTLTVGYVSPDLYTHSVSYFAHAPLQHHNSSAIRYIVYCCVPKADTKTELLQQVVESAGGIWRNVTSMSEVELSQLIRKDNVDVLVELTGHTAHNRLGVMALRSAPVQITWIGYPNSTGIAEVDYRITDAICDPLDTTQTFTEELVRLPGCFLCYTPAPCAPPVSPLPAASLGFVTFGSFNNLAKITDTVLACWARILKAVPTSRLLLKNKPFACESAKAHFIQKLEREGIEASRVDLLPLAAETRDHLGTYSFLDISLDPFPYAGTTTTTESLYMGVPCLTLAGKCHAHNVGVSLLHAVGLAEDWVAHSMEEYVELAVRAASDVAALEKTRATLRERFTSSPLCDGPSFTRQLEGVYRGLWDQWLEAHKGEQQPSSGGDLPGGVEASSLPLPAADERDSDESEEGDQGSDQQAGSAMPSATTTKGSASTGTTDRSAVDMNRSASPTEMGLAALASPPPGRRLSMKASGGGGSGSRGGSDHGGDDDDEDLGGAGGSDASHLSSCTEPGESALSECTSVGQGDHVSS